MSAVVERANLSGQKSNVLYPHWHLEKREGYLFLLFDRSDVSLNALNPESLTALQSILSNEVNTTIKGLVIQAAGERDFCAGADVHYFSQLKTSDEIENFLKLGQDVFGALARLDIPTVAVVQGVCLGGGLELALACRYIVAIDEDKTRFGLPESKLGIFPAWGGLHRLPRKIGAMRALPLMMQGRVLDAQSARKLGIVEEALPRRSVDAAVTFYLSQKPSVNRAKWWKRCLDWIGLRALFAKFFLNALKKKVSVEHYPAPFKMLEIWKRSAWLGVKAQERLDRAGIHFLIEEHPTAKSLIHVFHLQELLKQQAQAKDCVATDVHIKGAGMMGGDIAAWCVAQGLRVSLEDRNLEALARAEKRAQTFFRKKLKYPKKIAAACDRLILDPEGYGVAKADVIIEAVFEDLNVKHAVWKQIEAESKPGSLWLTNTSSLLLEEVSAGLAQPERLVGLHFFNPATLMPLVEVVRGQKTSDEYFQKSLSFARRIDKLPLVVQSAPGFLVNRLLMPYLLESMRLLEEGVPAYLIDETAKNFGMPMGPVELADTVGLDICLAVARNLSQHFGTKVPTRLVELVDAGKLGQKTQEGFFHYRNGKKVGERSSTPISGQNNILDRLLGVMLVEAAACLDEKIVDNADALDAGMVFGAGFPPFRGGLLAYASAMPVSKLDAMLSQIEMHHGSRLGSEVSKILGAHIKEMEKSF